MTIYRLHFVHVDSVHCADVTDHKAEAEAQQKETEQNEKGGNENER